MSPAVQCIVTHLPEIARAGLWLGVAGMMLYRLKVSGPETQRLVRICLALSGAGALGEALAIVVTWSAARALSIDLMTAGGLFGLLLAFSRDWAQGPPAVVQRAQARRSPRR